MLCRSITCALALATFPFAAATQTILHREMAYPSVGEDMRAILQPFGGCRDSYCSPDWEEEQIRRFLQEMRARELADKLKGGLPPDCRAAICVTERLELYTTLAPGPNLAIKRCEAAICVDIETPIVPNWIRWEILRASQGDPFGGCKDAMCVAPVGKVKGPDDESDADLKRLQEAEEQAKREKEAARQARIAAAQARAAAAVAKKEKDKADADAADQRAEQAQAQREVFESSRVRKAEEAADAAAEARASNQEAQEQRAARRAERAAQQQADLEKWTRNKAKVVAAEQAALRAQAKLDAAEANVDRRENQFRHAQESARMAAQVFVAELGAYPYLSTYMMACRGAGTGCLDTAGTASGNPDPGKKPVRR